MESKSYKGGIIYKINQKTEIERIGYYYAKNGSEDVKSAKKNLKKLYGRDPDIVGNAELFNFTTRRAASDVVAGGEAHRLTEGYGFAFPENKKAVFSYKNNVNAPDYIGAYPVLVRNGKEEAQNPAGITGSRGRTALGLDKNNENLYVMFVPDNKGATLWEIRSKFVAEGAENAINLDGGGSTQGITPNGDYLSKRKVRGFFYIYLKKAKEKETPKTEPAKVESVKAEPAKVTSKNVRVVTAKKGLNIRSGPGIWHKRVGGLAYGTKVTVLETSSTWCRIGENKWVSSLYLKK